MYIYILLMVFRIAFLLIYSGQLSEARAEDVAAALWLGARISLKTTAFLVAFPFVFGTIPYAIWGRWPAGRIRAILGSVAVGLMTLLFVIRIPYYEIFHQGYNIMLFNGMKDDKWAIWDTAVKQYQFWPRLLEAVLLMVLFIWLLQKILRTPVWQPQGHVRIWTGLAIVFVPVFAIFCRFGGAFHSDSGVPWESAARTKYVVLNEAILDDGQALYCAYSTHERATEKAVRPISEEERDAAIARLGGNPDADSIEEAFTRRTMAAPLARRPRHVIVILGENYALWPLLPEYRALGLAKTGEWLEANGAHTYHFLPNGNGTMTSLNGFLTGLPDIGLYVNYTMGLHGRPDGLGIGTMMKKMGYKTVFWYGGLRSWQDIEHFTLREGFDEFHCADELPEQGKSSSWGAPDGVLFDGIRERMKYDAEGFLRDEVAAKLPPSIPTDKATMDQLGHIWYADKVMGEFIRQVQKDDPSTLFVVTGDHAERFNFATDVSLWALSGIPCYFYGDGVRQDFLDEQMAGSHLQIAPTLAELIQPTGRPYTSLLPPLMKSERAFNHRLYIEDGEIGEQKNLTDEDFRDDIEAARTIASWVVMHDQ
ncbi:LTA synthase family protein [Mitsuokella multacida]|uniref:LTA synthase family protein n=1 Tax=Mitsuokella multacida TaxID=52226 RepID=UPI00242DD086|nr:LTA synthase family protein [Mitsuokella multacida]